MILAFVIISRSEPIIISPGDNHVDVPSPPQAPTLVFQGIENIVIAWQEPDFHYSVIATYEVQAAPPGSNFTTLSPGPGLQRVYEATGLVPEQLYYFRVRAVNGMGPGNYSEPSSFVTLAAIEPSPPSLPRVTSTTDGTISLSWQEVCDAFSFLSFLKLLMIIKTKLLFFIIFIFVSSPIFADLIL